jgi:hypothetical protein
MDKLFELTNTNLIEMTKSFKLKSGKMSNEIASSIDLKGKLFLYYKKLLNMNKSECPEGIRCEINKTNKKFVISNVPNYLAFNLHKQTNNLNLVDIFNTFVLIPRIFDIGSVFDQTAKQKNFYEFLGVVLMKPSKSYSACYKSTTSNQWTYYDDENVMTFPSWFDFIYYCLKHSEYPTMAFYQLEEKYVDSESDDLSNDEILILENYARNADSLNNIMQNKFRPHEDIIRLDSENLSNKGHSSKTTSISTSKNNSNNNSHSRLELGEYVCGSCGTKNRMESPLCYKCGRNNEHVIEEILRKRQMNNNYINIANFNLNINADDVSKVSIKPSITTGEKAATINRSKTIQNPFSSKNNKDDYDEEEDNIKSKIRLIVRLQYA